MEYYKKAKEIMDMGAVEFLGGVSENEIENAMNELSVIFPESYKAFLIDFGGGDAGGEYIFGITKEEDNDDNAVSATLLERDCGLPGNLVIIGFWADALVCLDTGKMENGECPVIEINEDYSEARLLGDSFGKFLYEYYLDE